MKSISGARAISVLPLLALAGCSVTQLPPAPEKLEPEVIVKTKTVDYSCSWFKPVYLAPTDIISDTPAKVIIGNNEAGAAHCGWKPLGK